MSHINHRNPKPGTPMSRLRGNVFQVSTTYLVTQTCVVQAGDIESAKDLALQGHGVPVGCVSATTSSIVAKQYHGNSK